MNSTTTSAAEDSIEANRTTRSSSFSFPSNDHRIQVSMGNGNLRDFGHLPVNRKLLSMDCQSFRTLEYKILLDAYAPIANESIRPGSTDKKENHVRDRKD